VLTPDGEQRRTVRPEILLELRVNRNITCVVERQVELNLIVAVAGQESAVQREGFRRNQCFVRDTVKVLRPGRFRREEVSVRPRDWPRSVLSSISESGSMPGSALPRKHC